MIGLGFLVLGAIALMGLVPNEVQDRKDELYFRHRSNHDIHI